MLENLQFCLSATLPVFILMLLGAAFMRLHLFNEAFVQKLNDFVFKVPLPVLVFSDLCTEDFYSVWDTKYVLFCFLATLSAIVLVWLFSLRLSNRTLQGEFIQASYRSSAALLGVTLMQNLYGDAGMAPLMIIGCVPLYNIVAVIVLTCFKPQRRPPDKALLLSTLKGIAANPIIIGIVCGLAWALLRLPMPELLHKTVSDVSGLATPLGLMAMGAAFDTRKAFHSAKEAGLAACFKLVFLCALTIPVAAAFGFRQEQLAAILIMCGSPTTISSYVMAKSMGHDGTLTGSTVMLTTLFCALTLTCCLFLLRSLGLL